MAQLVTGAWSDHVGRKWLIAAGMWVQALGIGVVVLSGSFADYLVPTAMDMPESTAVRILEETPTPLNPLGVKGAGEGGSSGCGGAIANAVADALSPLGVSITALPLSPDRLSALIRAAREKAR